MKRFITAIAFIIMASSVGITAHAAEMLDRDYIESEIWDEIWHGKGDNGMDFPEASYKHHLLDEWINENYGSDDYDWTSIGELKHEYKDYYRKLIEDWDFEDDRSGNWTISTEDNRYSFTMMNGMWQMLDRNGDTVDTFLPYSTLVEDDRPVSADNHASADNNGDTVGIAVGGTEMPSESLENSDSKVSVQAASSVSEDVTERTGANPLPLIVGGAAVVGIGAAFVIMKKKK